MCPLLDVALHLCEWGIGLASSVEFEFHPWTPDAFAIRYNCLFKSCWIRV